MPSRQPVRPASLPDRWLMTDERLDAGDDGALWRALARLPRGGGVVFRHHATPTAERQRLFDRVAQICRRRGLLLVLAGAPLRARGRQPGHGRHGSLTWPAHNRREAVAAVRAGATLVFVSPVFATRSHPGLRPLGPLRAAAIARGLPLVAIALGGMDGQRFSRLGPMGFQGWAAIDAWSAR